jgi:hypothetical protein
MIHDSGAFDGPVGNKGVSVYPGRVSADEAFLYNLHQAGTLNKPATQAQHQVKTIPRIKARTRWTSFRRVIQAAK